MDLKKGEALVVFIRRNDKEPDNYMVAIRRSESSFHPHHNDFEFGPFQIPINEIGNHPNFQTALDEAIRAVQKLQ